MTTYKDAESIIHIITIAKHELGRTTLIDSFDGEKVEVTIESTSLFTFVKLLKELSFIGIHHGCAYDMAMIAVKEWEEGSIFNK